MTFLQRAIQLALFSLVFLRPALLPLPNYIVIAVPVVFVVIPFIDVVVYFIIASICNLVPSFILVNI